MLLQENFTKCFSASSLINPFTGDFDLPKQKCLDDFSGTFDKVRYFYQSFQL
jgi:hypothetical protein